MVGTCLALSFGILKRMLLCLILGYGKNTNAKEAVFTPDIVEMNASNVNLVSSKPNPAFEDLPPMYDDAVGSTNTFSNTSSAAITIPVEKKVPIQMLPPESSGPAPAPVPVPRKPKPARPPQPDSNSAPSGPSVAPKPKPKPAPKLAPKPQPAPVPKPRNEGDFY
eukprot:NODE_1631_length_788_cov_77.375189_g1582_i0.p1 GENE.NODE_1631_length_788_cov_77.375189_g1582_i0~~NODE_1631_length_788_cov_77.375189_g1582_i0.p1  ORF type:complete len:165 (+),score=19.62 NODE_1631_length_788_cov_77.375189_g1582_i0:266-760(+)